MMTSNIKQSNLLKNLEIHCNDALRNAPKYLKSLDAAIKLSSQESVIKLDKNNPSGCKLMNNDYLHVRILTPHDVNENMRICMQKHFKSTLGIDIIFNFSNDSDEPYTLSSTAYFPNGGGGSSNVVSSSSSSSWSYSTHLVIPFFNDTILRVLLVNPNNVHVISCTKNNDNNKHRWGYFKNQGILVKISVVIGFGLIVAGLLNTLLGYEYPS